MQRRELLRAMLALSLPGGLAACGGGGGSASSPTVPTPDNGPAIASFSADKTVVNVGQPVTLTAVFSGGSGVIQPGNVAITSGVPLTLKWIDTGTLRLVVSAGAATASRELKLTLAYQNRFQTLALVAARAEHRTVMDAAGKVYVIGGSGNGTAAPVEVQVFDPLTETFSLAGELATGRFEHTVSLLPDGRILVLGGSRMTSGSPIAEIFDPKTGRSSAAPGQPQANRFHHSATVLADGRVLIVGGRISGDSVASRSADLYDPATGQFTRLSAQLGSGRRAHAAVRLPNGKVAIVGGADAAGSARPTEIFDPVTMSFSTIGGAADGAARMYAAAFLMPDSGDLVVVGGEDMFDAAPYDTMLRLGRDAGAMAAYGKLLQPRSAMAAAPLLDGRILVSGGTRDITSKYIAGTELVAVNGNSVAGPDMNVARGLATANLLPNGKVLVIGGADLSRWPQATAELFS